MYSTLRSLIASKESVPMFTYTHDLSNIRGISVSDACSGAVVGVMLSGTPDYDTSVESIALKVHVDYGNRPSKEIDVLLRAALHQALRAIQHEIDLCDAQNAALTRA